MRISHRHRFVFFASPKTGSRSVRKLLDTHAEIHGRPADEVNADFPFYNHMRPLELRAVFDEMEVPAQVTGVASLFGIHFTAQEIVDYRSTLLGDRDISTAFFLGMMNEGVLLQSTCAGALSVLSTEREVDALVDAARTVIQRVR